jgi:hypothetical protein
MTQEVGIPKYALGVVGQFASQNVPIIRKAVAATAKGVAEHPIAQRAIAIGVPAVVGGAVGGSPVSTIAGIMGLSGTSAVKRGAEAVAGAMGTNTPRMPKLTHARQVMGEVHNVLTGGKSVPKKPGQFLPLPAGRAAVNRVANVATRWGGPALWALDAYLNWEEYQQQKAAFEQEAMQRVREDVDSSRPQAPATPAQFDSLTDELLLELLKRQQ